MSTFLVGIVSHGITALARLWRWMCQLQSLPFHRCAEPQYREHLSWCICSHVPGRLDCLYWLVLGQIQMKLPETFMEQSVWNTLSGSIKE